MNITKNVTNVIGQMLEKEGFTYHKDYGTWEFKRKRMILHKILWF